MIRIGILFLVTLMYSATFSWATSSVPFRGMLDLSQEQLTISFNHKQAQIDANVYRQPSGDYLANIDVKHFQVGGVDIKSDIVLSWKEQQNNNQHVSVLEVNTNYSLLNGKPVKELSGLIRFYDRKMLIDHLNVGSVHIEGVVDPQQERQQLDVLFQFTDINIEMALNMTRPPHMQVVAQGDAQGEIKLTGLFQKMRLDVNVRIFDGYIDEFVFNEVAFMLDGIYPQVDVTHSLIAQPGTLPFSVEGRIDLTELSSFISQFKNLSKKPLLSETNKQREWIYRRISAGNDLESSATEYKYFLRKDEGFLQNRDDGQGMIGIERRMGF